MENKKIYKNKKIFFLITGLILIFSGIVIFCTSFVIEIPSGPQYFIENIIKCVYKFNFYLSEPIIELIDEIKTSRQAKEQIDSMQIELNKNRDMLIDYYNLKKENLKLLKFHEIKNEHQEIEFLAADVLGTIPFNDYGDFIIDCGTNKGVSTGDTVVSNEGVVGVISRAGSTISSVKTILSPKVFIGASSNEANSSGIISGDKLLAKKGSTCLNLINSINSIKKNDILITSGSSGIYPKKLKIGKVESIYYNPSNSSYSANVKPFANINNIQFVFVITKFSGENFIDIKSN